MSISTRARGRSVNLGWFSTLWQRCPDAVKRDRSGRLCVGMVLCWAWEATEKLSTKSVLNDSEAWWSPSPLTRASGLSSHQRPEVLKANCKGGGFAQSMVMSVKGREVVLVVGKPGVYMWECESQVDLDPPGKQARACLLCLRGGCSCHCPADVNGIGRVDRAWNC